MGPLACPPEGNWRSGRVGSERVLASRSRQGISLALILSKALIPKEIRQTREGDFYPFHNEAADGFDTQEWIGRQPWANGKIGMPGASYPACVQWLSARLRSKYLS